MRLTLCMHVSALYVDYVCVIVTEWHFTTKTTESTQHINHLGYLSLSVTQQAGRKSSKCCTRISLATRVMVFMSENLPLDLLYGQHVWKTL